LISENILKVPRYWNFCSTKKKEKEKSKRKKKPSELQDEENFMRLIAK